MLSRSFLVKFDCLGANNLDISLNISRFLEASVCCILHKLVLANGYTTPELDIRYNYDPYKIYNAYIEVESSLELLNVDTSVFRDINAVTGIIESNLSQIVDEFYIYTRSNNLKSKPILNINSMLIQTTTLAVTCEVLFK